MDNISPIAAAAIRAGRVLAAAALAAVIVAVPQAVGIFQLDGAYSGAAILAITSFLNGLGKYLRDTNESTTVV